MLKNSAQIQKYSAVLDFMYTIISCWIYISAEIKKIQWKYWILCTPLLFSTAGLWKIQHNYKNFQQCWISCTRWKEMHALTSLWFIFCAYLFRDLEVVYSLKTTLERIVFTSSAFYIYLVLYFINNLLKVKKWII